MELAVIGRYPAPLRALEQGNSGETAVAGLGKTRLVLENTGENTGPGAENLSKLDIAGRAHGPACLQK